MMKILNAEDLSELKKMGYTVRLIGQNKALINPVFINPNTFWSCAILDTAKLVYASLYKYIPKNDRSNVSLIRY